MGNFNNLSAEQQWQAGGRQNYERDQQRQQDDFNRTGEAVDACCGDYKIIKQKPTACGCLLAPIGIIASGCLTYFATSLVEVDKQISTLPRKNATALSGERNNDTTGIVFSSIIAAVALYSGRHFLKFMVKSGYDYITSKICSSSVSDANVEVAQAQSNNTIVTIS
jgi:hypothetical protein